MAEKESTIVSDESEELVAEKLSTQPEEAATVADRKSEFSAKFKEWRRKKIVALKRKPQMIALLFLLIASVYFMFVLYPVTEAAYSVRDNLTGKNPFAGLCLFVTTLLSLLVLVSFLNAFPKRKKPNLVFIIMVYAMVAAMIGFDLWYYFQMSATIGETTSQDSIAKIAAGQPFMIVHIVLLGLFVVIFALLPVYSKLINKINTSVKLESATENMKQIDIQED